MEIHEGAPEGFRTFATGTYASEKAAVRQAGKLANLGAVVVHVAETGRTKEHWLVGAVAS